MLREDLYLYSDKHVSDNLSRRTVHCASLTAVSRIQHENIEVLHNLIINLLTPNVNYSDRTASLTSKVAFNIFIQQIKVLNILNMVYTLSFFLFKMQFVS